MSKAESSKQAKKRKLKEKIAIVAALRNSSNGGIRISDRNDGSPLTSQANDFHLSKKKSCVSEKSNSKKNNKSVKGATKRSKMSKMASRDTNDVDPTNGDFSAEEDAHDFSEDDEIIPNSYSHGSRKNPTSNESHKSTKEGGSTKSKSFKKVEKRSRTKMDSSHDSSDEDYCSAEDGSKGTANRAKSKGPLIEEESEGDSIDLDEESESDEDDPSTKESHQSSKTPRGLCRSKVMATDSGCKLMVTFNANGQPVGENSDKFSSYLGSIASEMVPLTYSDWRAIRKGYKDLYWQSVLQKFILDEGRRTYALQQIGRLWRAHKSRLRGKIRIYRKKKKDIACLKPTDCDLPEWEMFLKQMSRRKFTLKSQKFQEMRENQELPHTCSRQGYARLEYQMQKESPNPSSITRVDVWCKGHTKKSGEPSNNIVAERMKKMKEIRDSAASDSFNHSIQNDALSQVLGPDRYSRVRGKGAGVTPSKLGVVSQDKQMVTQLQEEVLMVKKDLVQMANLVNTQNELIRNLLAAVNTQKGESQKVVTEQEIQSTSAPITSLSQGQGIGSGDQGIQTTPQVHFGVNSGATRFVLEQQAVNEATFRCPDEFGWKPQKAPIVPADGSITRTREGQDIGRHGIQSNLPSTFPQGQGIGSNDQASIQTTPSTTLLQSHGRQCKLLNWAAPHELVAKGRWESDDPFKPVHGVPLGDNASKVWVEKVVNAEPRLWRENSELQTVGDAKGTAIAWPSKHIIFTDHHAK